MSQNHLKPKTGRKNLLSSLPVILPTAAVLVSAVFAVLLLRGHSAADSVEEPIYYAYTEETTDESYDEAESYDYTADGGSDDEYEIAVRSVPDEEDDASAQHIAKDRILSAGETEDAAELVDSFASVPLFSTGDEIIAQHVREQLSILEDYFPDGMYWNHVGVDTSGMTDEEKALCVTDTPCNHSAYGYGNCNIYNGLTDDFFPQYGDEMQCLGYASLISDLLFGKDMPITKFYDFEDLRIGDHIRMGWYEHSMIVTDIDWDTETVTVTEVNADYESCKISWGRQITRAELENLEGDLTYYTRYPD